MTLTRKDIVNLGAPDPTALLMLGVLSRWTHVYAGTAYQRPQRRRLAAAKARRRQRRLDQITARSQYVRSHA